MPVYALLLSSLSLAEDAPASVPTVSLPPAPAPAPAANGARVTFESTHPNLKISVIEGRATGTGYTSTGGTATVQTTFYRDLCVAPCVVDTAPGLLEFFGTGGGHVAVARQLDIRAGENKVLVEPGSSALRTVGLYAFYTGLAAVSFGAIEIALGGDGLLGSGQGGGIALIAGGVVVGAGGVVLKTKHRGQWTVTQP